MNQFNLYNEKSTTRQVTGHDFDTNDEILIVLDFSKQTFGEMVDKVRSVIENVDPEVEINLFMVCGYNPHPDAGLFLDYLKSVTFKFRLFFRGIIHVEFLKIFSSANLSIKEGSKFKFDPKRTHEFQTELLSFPNIFRNYFQRFIDDYHKLKGETYFDLTELKTLGFNFEIF